MAADTVLDMAAKLGLDWSAVEWSKADDAIDRLKSGIKQFIGIVSAAVGINAVKGWVEDTLALAGQLDDLAQQTGVSREALQELGYAAALSGADLETAAMGLKKLAVGMQDAAKTGKGPLVDGLNAIGISLSSLKGESLDQNLEAIASAFAKMPDGAKKAAAAADIFGAKIGPKLIPLLNEGQEGIVKLREAAREAGVVLGEQTVKDLEAFGDEVDVAKMSLGGLKNQVVAALLPTLREMLQSLMTWVRENRELIASGLEVFITGVMYALQGLGAAVSFVVDIFKFFIEHSELGISVLTALGIVMTAFAAKAALAWIAALGPIALLIAALTAIVYGIRWMIKNWDKVKGAVGAVWDWILDKVRRVWGAMKRIGEEVVDFFVGVGEAISNAFDAAWEAIKKGARDTANYIRNIPVLKQLGDFGEWLVPDDANSAGNDAYENYRRQAENKGETPMSESEFNRVRDVNRARGAAQPPPVRDDGAMVPVNPATGAMSGSITIDVGGVQVTPAPGMDEVALGKEVAVQLSSVLRQQLSATTGRVA